MTTQPSPTSPEPQPQPVSQETYLDRLRSMAKASTEDWLLMVPELAGVTVVLAFKDGRDELPWGFTHTQEAMLSRPEDPQITAKLLHNLIRGQADSVALHGRAIGQLIVHRSQQDAQKLSDEIAKMERLRDSLADECKELDRRRSELAG